MPNFHPSTAQPLLPFSSHLPRYAVALGTVVAEVSYLAVLDVHSRLPHVVLSPAVAGLAVVQDDLRDGADVRPPIGVFFVIRVRRRIPPKHLRRGGRAGKERLNVHSR